MDERIRAILDAADVAADDRDLWISRLDAAGERAKAVFVEIFGDDLDALRFFTGNLRARMEAGNDREKQDAILDAEREYFRAALNATTTE